MVKRAPWRIPECFFSGRRRHTRFDCDWSSDVCSSDLAVAVALRLAAAVDQNDVAFGRLATAVAKFWVRSEERRVGKEGRARWSPELKKKNALGRFSVMTPRRQRWSNKPSSVGPSASSAVISVLPAW